VLSVTSGSAAVKAASTSRSRKSGRPRRRSRSSKHHLWHGITPAKAEEQLAARCSSLALLQPPPRAGPPAAISTRAQPTTCAASFSKLLDKPPHNLSISRLPLADGNRRFFDAGLFFVHAAKVRPIRDSSPPDSCMQYCARHHLRAEIEYIAPNAVCFLGETHARPAAEELFGRNVGAEPRKARIGSWAGLVAVSPQPVRSNKFRDRAKQIVDRLLADL
jgi:hypothetical protein